MKSSELAKTKNIITALIYGCLRFIKNKPLGGTFGIILCLVFLMAIFADFIAPHDPLKTNPLMIKEPPDSKYWFGYDEVGRDVLSRVIHGSRISLLVGLSSVLLGTTFGGLWGLASGYLGGWFDLLSQRAVEIWMSFPSLVLAMSLLVAMGSGVETVIVAVAFTRVPTTVRVIRSVSIAVREFMYVDAAVAIGASQTRIMLRHILPNCVAAFIVMFTAHVGTAIIIEASLAFLGIGVPPPAPTWGAMLGSATSAAINPQWWRVLYPGVAIVLVVLSFNLFGDAIRDVLDPRLRGSQDVG